MKPKIDIIVLSNTANEMYLELLGITINSIKEQTNVDSYVILVETNKDYKSKEQYGLPIDLLLIPNEKFNFNRFLNYGLKFCTADNICFSNNDVLYYENSLYNLIEGLKEYDSVSPFAYGYSEGMKEDSITECYQLDKCFFGFCHCITREAMKNCFNNKFDENFVFWYQDDDIIFTIEDKGFKHGLVGNAKVNHLQFSGAKDKILKGRGSNSYELFGEEQYHHLWGQHPLFRTKWKNNLKRK
jgi:glycosyltransferase involved in cell wall biosynthesis